MNVSSAIKKGNKLSGLEVTIDNRNLHLWEYKGQIISFYPNGKCTPESEIACIMTRRKNDNSDSMTDYCAETFHDNLTRAFKFVDQCHLMSNVNAKDAVMCH